MNFPMSILTTCLITGVIWLGLVVQPASPPTTFEKYSSAQMDYETMGEVGYALAAFGREAAAEYFDLDGYKALAGTTGSVETSALEKSETVGSRPVVLSKNEIPELSSAVAMQPSTIVGISKTINMAAINDLWKEFSEQTALSKQLKSNNYTIYAVYSEFDPEFSEARVSIGYLDSSMRGKRMGLPGGKQTSLLAAGKHSDAATARAWEKIDYSRPVIAVLERRDYSGDQETISSFVIYQ